MRDLSCPIQGQPLRVQAERGQARNCAFHSIVCGCLLLLLQGGVRLRSAQGRGRHLAGAAKPAFLAPSSSN